MYVDHISLILMSSSMSTVKRTSKGKRRGERNILTFYEKIAVIRYYDETNISRNSLAKMFHCCATQIRRILERKDELLQQLATLSEADASIIIEEMTRKRRKFEMCAISFILHQWVERCRQLRLRKSITNQTLKDTAIKMAAILNLPTFRPSYRWLNRFRGKYKYNEQDLGSPQPVDNNFNSSDGIEDISVEDIIIEFKDSLPSFMQKEISLITSTTKVDEVMQENLITAATISTQSNKNIIENSKDFETSAEEDDEFEDVGDGDGEAEAEAEEVLERTQAVNNTLANTMPDSSKASAGTTALLNSVFPHLAVIHQFALLNSDIKALELISHLGVHMQTQAAEGAYKQMSLEAVEYGNGIDSILDPSDTVYAADLDDIVLIE